MKATFKSEFHNGLKISFSGLNAGENLRKIRNRGKFCLDYRNQNSHVCGCGFPVNRTSVEVAGGNDASIREVGENGDEYGRGWFLITVHAN